MPSQAWFATPARPATAKLASVPARASRGAISDQAILKKTGHGLDHWFAVLDAFDPKAKGHTDRARYLYDEHQVPGWHSQGIVVAYERARSGPQGLRAVRTPGTPLRSNRGDPAMASAACRR